MAPGRARLSAGDFQSAAALYRAGRRTDAAAALDAMLAREPAHADALHLRAVIAIEDGAPAVAADLLQRLLAARPDAAAPRVTLGHAQLDLGRTDAALGTFRDAIARAPDLAAAHDGLGLAFQALGNWTAAAAAHRRAAALQPDDADSWTNLGNAFWGLRRLDNAIAAHRKAVALRPDVAVGYANLATALRAAGRGAEAIAAYRSALARDPGLAAVHNDLGTALREQGQTAEALAAFDRALALAPADAGAHYNRGVALSELDRLTEAAAALRRAIELDGVQAAAHFALGNILRDLGDLSAAAAEFRAATAADPGFAEAWSNLLFLLPCLPEESEESLARANRAWAATAEAAAPALPAPDNGRDPDRVIRIGYVSSELRQHHFLAEFLPVLRAHDRRSFHIGCYADVAAPDAETARVAGLADAFRNLHGLDMAAQAEIIRGDRIDILVSLTGYLARDRRLFAARVAPVQATYINHVTTTGLGTVDCRITDAWLDPHGHETALDPERPIRLASGFSVFEPGTAPEPGPPPALHAGGVTFGAFNNLIKASDQALALWAAVLAAVPGSRLLVKARDLSRPAAHAAFHERLRAAGIDPARCELIGLVRERADSLAAYALADIGLDPAPFTGGATTREMLWMGVPVVTLAGATRAARLGSSLLHRCGLSELVASTPAEYVRIAAGLAADLPHLAALRRDLRARVAASQLIDAPAHTRELEAVYRTMWTRWCRGEPPGGQRR